MRWLIIGAFLTGCRSGAEIWEIQDEIRVPQIHVHYSDTLGNPQCAWVEEQTWKQTIKIIWKKEKKEPGFEVH